MALPTNAAVAGPDGHLPLAKSIESAHGEVLHSHLFVWT